MLGYCIDEILVVKTSDFIRFSFLHNNISKYGRVLCWHFSQFGTLGAILLILYGQFCILTSVHMEGFKLPFFSVWHFLGAILLIWDGLYGILHVLCNAAPFPDVAFIFWILIGNGILVLGWFCFSSHPLDIVSFNWYVEAASYFTL